MYLPDDIVSHIVSFLDLYTNLQTARFIDKSFFRACCDENLWKHLSLRKITGKQLCTMLRRHGPCIQSLDINNIRVPRKAHRVLGCMKSLVMLDLKSCSSYLIDDRFCYLLRTSSIKSLLIGNSSITDLGLITLKNLKLKEFEMHNSIFVTQVGIDFLGQWQCLKRLDLHSVDGVFEIHHLHQLPLTHLRVSFCRNLNTSSVLKFCKESNPKLKSFLLYGFLFTKATLKAITKSFFNLEMFALCHPSITQRQYEELKHFKNMKFLSIICCSRIENVVFLRKLKLSQLYVCKTKIFVKQKKEILKLKNIKLKYIY